MGYPFAGPQCQDKWRYSPKLNAPYATRHVSHAAAGYLPGAPQPAGDAGDPAEQQSDGRHQDVVHQARDDGAESPTDNKGLSPISRLGACPEEEKRRVDAKTPRQGLDMTTRQFASAPVENLGHKRLAADLGQIGDTKPGLIS